MNEECVIRIAAVRGSVRPGNFTSQALDLVVEQMSSQAGVGVDLIDPSDLDLALPGRQGSAEDEDQLQQVVSQATGIVLSTPEYHGSYSSAIKLVIENLGFPSALAGKPVALLGVAGGQIGAVKALEHLRSVCSHVGAIVLPGPVSVANVQDQFDDDGQCLDEELESRIRGLGNQLVDYIRDSICPRAALEAYVRAGTA
jgi:chromate reductase